MDHPQVARDGRRWSQNEDAHPIIELFRQLEEDPGEYWLALEGMTALELDIRESIFEELALHRERPEIARLLGLLASSSDAATRRLAAGALDREAVDLDQPLTVVPQGQQPGGQARALAIASDADATNAPPAVSPVRMARCLVTPMNGDGRGWVVVSTSHADQRRTAAFLCDINEGVVDVFGDVETESDQAGALIDQVRAHAQLTCSIDDPELALGLLAGTLSLNPSGQPAQAIRDWLEGTLGRGFRPASFVVVVPELQSALDHDAHIAISDCAQLVLSACPSWLDRSTLTFQLAEEISLREAKCKADPARDAGAYRFLFEHRLIHQLEVYRRMLWWMAGLWNSSGEHRLSHAALALAAQLSDEQFAVPSHPFTVQLTTRSLRAAQTQLRTSNPGF
jgi:hypothetical protein